MNRDDIIRMAKEAEAWSLVDHDGIAALERFAHLVAAAERERIIAANAPEIEKVNVYIKALEDAAEALRARLAGWERVNMHDHKAGDLGIGTVEWDASAPLVVHPHPAFQTTEPQREWIGLTDEEIDACVHENMTISDSRLRDAVYGVVLSTEAKLKEKNNA